MSVKVVAHPTTGQVITPSVNNPEWGTFRVDSVHTSFENGIVNVQKRSAFIRGKLEHLNGLKLKDGLVLPGQIIKKESYEPFYEGQPCKIYPSGERQGQPVLTNGRETYLEYEYTQDLASCDVFFNSQAVVETPSEAIEEQEM